MSPAARPPRVRRRCCVCGSAVRVVLDLPGLPLTGIYVGPRARRRDTRHDQALGLCARCGHAQLTRALDPRSVYDGTYEHRSSSSALARRGNDALERFIARVAGGRRFKRAVEVGCNDLYLTRRLARRARQVLGVDPIWRHRRPPKTPANIRVSGSYVEDLDAARLCGGRPDLIVSAHTWEHLERPLGALSSLVEDAADGALVVLEVPSFDTLLRDARFDQVFHQHLQYFGLASMLELLKRSGLGYLTHTHNPDYWGGTLLIAALKGVRPRKAPRAPRATPALVRRRYAAFKARMRACMSVVTRQRDGVVYGYGAAQMLPVLAYHMGTDLSELRAVLDDDPARQGRSYPGLRPRIARPEAHRTHLTEATVLVTAPDSARPIARRLSELGARRIVVPLVSW
ncbi:MAG: hypothetical protein MOGMAGMI_00024 [Candidatus Omnitrophica bacterium]|nr:hypothetical protein [Candidatus Omnitrophota bacterium]